ncbi:MAG: proteasome subunit beta [Dermatophilus congolensis]|nr:proteasome subunit beta [Dermatophilus congolensis]
MTDSGVPLSGVPGSSFVEHLQATAPHLLPSARVSHTTPGGESLAAPHGTTIVAAVFDGGVAIAGDRRATLGHLIASHDIEKVFITDSASAVGIAGTAGIAVELVKLFGVELEHYEKIEGARLSTEGKANRLATMLRGHLPLAMQGLAVLPMLVAYDPSAGKGRIYSYDVTGGCYEERDHHSVGSGSLFSRGSLKKLWRRGMTADDAVRVLVEALFDAADDDSATGGPDVSRRIWPTCAVVTADDAEIVSDEHLERVVESVVQARRSRWDSVGAR